jgi:hypothetical protein
VRGQVQYSLHAEVESARWRAVVVVGCGLVLTVELLLLAQLLVVLPVLCADELRLDCRPLCLKSSLTNSNCSCCSSSKLDVAVVIVLLEILRLGPSSSSSTPRSSSI